LICLFFHFFFSIKFYLNKHTERNMKAPWITTPLVSQCSIHVATCISLKESLHAKWEQLHNFTYTYYWISISNEELFFLFPNFCLHINWIETITNTSTNIFGCPIFTWLSVKITSNLFLICFLKLLSLGKKWKLIYYYWKKKEHKLRVVCDEPKTMHAETSTWNPNATPTQNTDWSTRKQQRRKSIRNPNTETQRMKRK